MEKLFIAGHKGMVGSAMLRFCEDYKPIIVDKSRVDLRNQQQVDDVIAEVKPDKVAVCAGGLTSFRICINK